MLRLKMTLGTMLICFDADSAETIDDSWICVYCACRVWNAALDYVQQC
jgi:hypothetical protein